MKKNEDSYGHVLKYMGVFGGVQGVNMLMSLVRNKIMAVLLGPAGMGLNSLLNTAVTFVSQSTSFGISASAVKQTSEYYGASDTKQLENYVKVVRSWTLMTALLGTLVCILIGPLLNYFSFSWGNHQLHFILLAPSVGMMAITGGETAILKGVRQLRSIASIQVFAGIASVILSIPIYYFFGLSGIVPVIVLMSLVTMLLTLRQSSKLFPLDLSFRQIRWKEGRAMLKLGTAFVVAGIWGSGAELVIRSFLNFHGNLDVVGMYNAGYMLMITITGVVLSAMDADYFPRLSAVNSDTAAVNEIVNQQIEVSLYSVLPLMVLIQIYVPIVVPLLYSSDFSPIVEMLQLASFSMIFKVMALPISYQTLAKGDSLAYMTLEIVCDVMMIVIILVGFTIGNLNGTGIALSVMWLAEFSLLAVCTHWRYGFSLSGDVVRTFVAVLTIGVLSFCVTAIESAVCYWLLGTVVFLSSVGFSLRFFIKKVGLSAIRQRLRKK